MTLLIIKEVTVYSVTKYRTLLLLLDLDHFIFIIVVLLASKSLFVSIFRLPFPVTLRLGTVLKAIPMPVSVNRSNFIGLAATVGSSH